MLTRGAVAKTELIQGIRELTKDDLSAIKGARSTQIVQRLRDPHHRLARMVASGLKPGEAAQAAGYSYTSLSVLQRDPAFQELVSHYRQIVEESFVESQDVYHELATANMLKAERHIAEQIEAKEEAGELLPIRDALAISRDAADRFGYGKKTTNLNVNVDFAAKLEQAHRRSQRVIESAAVSSPASTPQLAGRVYDPRPSQQPMVKVLRRA